MAIQTTRGTDAWIERISVQEMPALCATVRMLEKMAQDDNMSLADLGKSILHDNGLTTRFCASPTASPTAAAVIR
jgi:hypothetical protein